MQLADLRENVESLTEELQRQLFSAASGTSGSLELTPLFKRNAETVSWEAFGLVREARDRSEGKRAARLGALLHHLYRLLEDSSAAGALAAQHAAEVATVSGTEPGQQLPVRVALVEAGLVGDRDKRAALERRAVEAVLDGGSALARRFESAQSIAQKAGFASAGSAHAALSELDLTAFAAEAEAFLSSTEAMYEDVFGWWLRRTTGLRLFPDGAERHDWLHALALQQYEGIFPHGEAVAALAGRLAPMGLPPLADGRIRLDTDRRDTKAPEPVVAPLAPPTQVAVSIRRGRGWVDTRDLLFGLGMAQHFAHVEEARPFEDRVLGDQAVPRAMGELFSHWLLDKGWLKRVLDNEVTDLPRLLALVELARVRLLAASFLHSLQIDREGPRAAQAPRYAERLSLAMKVAWPEGLWLRDADFRLGHATALRATALETRLAEDIRERFDEDWWKNPRSGPYLKKLFAQGQQESAAVLAERLGFGPLSLDRVARRLEALLV